MYPPRRPLRKLDWNKLREPFQRPIAHTGGFNPLLYASPCRPVCPATPNAIALSQSERHAGREAARHVPEIILRSPPCIIQMIRMDVFFQEGNSGENAVSKRIAGGIERDTVLRCPAAFPLQTATHRRGLTQTACFSMNMMLFTVGKQSTAVELEELLERRDFGGSRSSTPTAITLSSAAGKLKISSRFNS